MESSTMAVVTVYAILIIAFSALWLKHKSMMKKSQKFHTRLGSLQGNLNDASSSLELLSRGVNTILSDTPEVHGLLDVHKSLENAEKLLLNQSFLISSSESCAIATHATRSILSHYPGIDVDGKIDVVPGLLPLTKRLDSILTESNMRAEDIELNGHEQRRIGELFHAMGKIDRASDCYKMAHELTPEDIKPLRSLANIQREKGDFDSLDISLERLLAVNPDDTDVLQEQILLLLGSDSDRIKRNQKRLEGLGVDSLQESENVNELSNIMVRANRAGSNSYHDKSQNSDDLVHKATKLLLLGEINTALEYVDKALSLDNKNGKGWLLHSRILATNPNKIKEALNSIKKAKGLGEFGIIVEAEILENNGKSQPAIEVLEEFLVQNPENPEVRAKLSLLLLRSGTFEWAKKVIEDAPAESWDHEALHVMKGRLYLFEVDEYRDNTGNYDQMLLLESISSFDSAIEYNRESGLAWLGRSRALRYQGAYNEAEIALVRARRLIPKHPSISLEEAQLALDLGNLDQANAMISEASTLLNNNPSISFIKGLIAAKKGHLAEAQGFFTRTLEMDENHVRARLNRCSAALLREELSLALDDANLLVETRPSLDLAKLRRSEILMNLGDWPEAESELRLLLKKNPEYTMALVHLGTCMNAMGRAEQAEKPLNKAINIDPQLSEAWYQRGLLYVDFARLEEAFSDFESAVRCNPRHLDANLRMAAILHEGEYPEKAVSAWRAVLDIDPEHRLARRRLEESREKAVTKNSNYITKH
ncbi:MAG: tetratricopeptide repeat protein [Candidatus Poseidoniales archaeon]|jgi:tetratricopeptide (TPR) repeat protein|tara:strand:+ start:14328 stop:16622 length:2295 start_codon:yes stop_codon:yes gene_type:complete